MEKKAKDLNKAIENEIDYLTKLQNPDGSFGKQNKNNFPIYPSCLVLSCLHNIRLNKAKKIREKLVRFLLRQKSSMSTFNRFKRNSSRPNPDDLESTFSALSSLSLFDPKLISGKELAQIVLVLTSCEASQGGPYFSWIVEPKERKKWGNIDLAANSNIAFFLSLQKINLENIDCLIEKAIRDKQFNSVFYSSDFLVIYFISRFYKGRRKQELIEFLLNKLGPEEDLFNVAITVSSILNLEVPISKIQGNVEYLIEKIVNGETRKLSSRKNKTNNSILTSAFVIEALSKYSQSLEKSSQNSIKNEEKEIKQEVLKSFSMLFADFDSEAKVFFQNYADKILEKDKINQITLLPYYFQQAISYNDLTNPTNKDLIIKLGLTSLLGWVSYTIYDDFLDKDGNPKLLPLANICFLELHAVINSVFLQDNNIKKFFIETIHKTERANFIEVTKYRSRISQGKLELSNQILNQILNHIDFSFLADRSLGQAIMPIAVLYNQGLKLDSLESKWTISFLKNYIIARQINDDLHDWEADLNCGRLSPVVLSILHCWKDNVQSEADSIDLKKNSTELQEIFWFQIIPEICETMLEHLDLARKSLKKISVITNPEVFENWLNSLEKSVEKTLDERKKGIEFLESYSS